MPKHTPGAIRAGKNISDRFRKALPHLPESNAHTLAEIIDRETAAPELLEALEAFLAYDRDGTFTRSDAEQIFDQLTAKAEAAIRKARGL